MECQKLDKILKRFGELNLICLKALEKGELYIPKMKDYADEWHTRLSREAQEQLRIDKNRIDIDKIRYILHTFLEKKKYPKEPEDLTFYYKRFTNTIKRLLLLTKGDSAKVIKAMNWFGDICDKKGFSWTLETIEKWLPEYLSKGEAMAKETLRKEFGLK